MTRETKTGKRNMFKLYMVSLATAALAGCYTPNGTYIDGHGVGAVLHETAHVIDAARHHKHHKKHHDRRPPKPRAPRPPRGVCR